MSLTTNPNDPCLSEGQKEVGQNECYLVLTEEERAKGFIRPFRDAYIHMGTKIERDKEGRILGRLIQIGEPNYPKYPKDDYYTKENGYGGYIMYPSDHSTHAVGRYIKLDELEAIIARKSHFGGCGIVTKMGRALSETYARDPKFYGATFCVGCNKHLPVSEFLWDGTDEKVGS